MIWTSISIFVFDCPLEHNPQHVLDHTLLEVSGWDGLVSPALLMAKQLQPSHQLGGRDPQQ
jgi:hypothetical protein